MLKHKYIDAICITGIILAVLGTILFINGEQWGLQKASSKPGYVSRLFDKTKVHQIDIHMDDWEGFLANAHKEEYTSCTVVIDGEIFHEVHHTVLVDVFSRLQKLHKRIHVHVEVKSRRGKQLFPEFPHDRLGTDLRLGPLIHRIQKFIRWDLSVHPVHHTVRAKDKDDEIIQGMGLGTKDLRDGDHDRRGSRWVIQHHPGKVHALHQVLHLVDSCRDTNVFRIGFTVNPIV